MGFESRDYARDDVGRGGWGNSGGISVRDWPAWKKILAANIVVYLLQMFLNRSATPEEFEFVGNVSYLPQISIIQEWFQLDSRKVLHGQVWRVLTCGFCHSTWSVWHILMNMLFLFWFGRRLESRFGSREFTLFYFGALLLSSLAHVGLDLYTQSSTPAIGASGAIWGVVALYALLYPHETIRVYFLFPVQIWVLALLYFIYDLHPVLLSLSGEHVSSGVAHASHVGGAVFGFLYYQNSWTMESLVNRFLQRKKRFANSRTKSDKRRTISIFGNADSNNQAEEREIDEKRMDSILAKISLAGRETLTEEENAFLIRQSSELRARRQES